MIWIALCAAGAIAIPSLVHADPVPPTFNWDASAPGTTAGQWGANVGSQQWSVSGASQTTPGTSYPGITGAFSFGPGDTATSGSFQTIAGGNPSNEDLSLELWFRPLDMNGGQQVLFETGGNQDGLSLLLDDSLLLFRVKDGGTVVTLSYDLGLDASEFFQVAITLDLNTTASLFVDGLLVDSGSAAGINDWTNNNGSGLGTVNNQLGGNAGDLNGFGDFAGELSILRFYRSQVLTPAQVAGNFQAVPEPGTAVLVALGLIGLRHAGRRRR